MMPGAWVDLRSEFRDHQKASGNDDPVSAAVSFVKSAGHALGDVEVIVALDQRTGDVVLAGTTNDRENVSLPADWVAPQFPLDHFHRISREKPLASAMGREARRFPCCALCMVVLYNGAWTTGRTITSFFPANTMWCGAQSTVAR